MKVLSLILISTLLSFNSFSGELKNYRQEKKRIEEHLAVFDDLDFNVFSHQQWERLGHSHTADVIVHWPDGHITQGLQKHTEDLKSLFVAMPDTRISAHPIKLGQGDYTSVMGDYEGTFSEPMPIGNGQTIPPTGKKLKMQMVTIGHWNKDGLMDEEWLFWDNKTYMDQIGLGK